MSPISTPNSSRVGGDVIDAYCRHAERFGVELVFETACGLGDPAAELTVTALVELARCLKVIDPRFDPGRPDQLVELIGAGHMCVADDFPSNDPDKRYAYQRDQARCRWLEQIAPVTDALATPAPTRAGRVCEWCGTAIAGRADRRTCSSTRRKALDRSGGAGPFSRPDVTPSAKFDPPVAPGRNVTSTPREHGRFRGEKPGVRELRELQTQGGNR